MSHARQKGLVNHRRADAVQALEAKANALLTQANANRELSCSLAHQRA